MLRGAHGAPRGARLLPMPGVTRVTYENNSHDENFPLNQLPEKIDPLHSRWRTPTLRVLEGLGEDATDWPDLRYPLCQRAAGGSGDPSLCLPSLKGTEPCPTGQRAARAARSAENRGGPDWTRHAGVPVGCAGASPGPDGGALGGGGGPRGGHGGRQRRTRPRPRHRLGQHRFCQGGGDVEARRRRLWRWRPRHQQKHLKLHAPPRGGGGAAGSRCGRGGPATRLGTCVVAVDRRSCSSLFLFLPPLPLPWFFLGTGDGVVSWVSPSPLSPSVSLFS